MSGVRRRARDVGHERRHLRRHRRRPGCHRRPRGLGEPHRYYTGYYDELPGVSLEKEDLPELAPDRSADRELFYELDVDLHVIDPKRMEHTFGLDEDDVEELEENVAPFSRATCAIATTSGNRTTSTTTSSRVRANGRGVQAPGAFRAVSGVLRRVPRGHPISDPRGGTGSIDRQSAGRRTGGVLPAVYRRRGELRQTLA
ncbi:hypothetical protein D8S78_04435 [Natrialba swarupiae]|nr:hypothetical protein [Natrialba swarupiae]